MNDRGHFSLFTLRFSLNLLFIFHLILYLLPYPIGKPTHIKELEAMVQHDREQIEYFLGFGDP